MYDYLLVGSGLFNAVFAFEATKRGKKCLVLEKRGHIGGNIYTKTIEDIRVHVYGAHIFHTSRRDIWEYMQQFATFHQFINAPIANYRGEIYNLPFNMNTFSRMWNISTPAEAMEIIAKQRSEITGEPKNLEEKAISLVGRDVYLKLIKEYTEKQWGRPCSELSPTIIDRLPVRFTYDNNYFNDIYQGIPNGGYTPIVEKMLSGCKISLHTDFLQNRELFTTMAKKIIYTGTIDGYFNYCYGPLEYRSLRFEHEVLDLGNLQGVAVMNFTDSTVPYTRRIEHKHFEPGTQQKTVVSYEYSYEWAREAEPYYPIANAENAKRYRAYAALGAKEPNTIFGGRLGTYKYMDMQDVVADALRLAQEEFGE